MSRTHLKLALRSLSKNKAFSVINVFGLAIGLTCCMLISMYLVKEFSYDSHHKLGKRLYQLGSLSIEEGVEKRGATTAAPMGPAMQQEFAEVENVARVMTLFQDDKTLFQTDNGVNQKSFYESNGLLADSTFFRMFSYSFTEGDPLTALDQPNSIVLSQEIAEKLFDRSSALNKVIHINSNTLDGAVDFKVTGVFKPSKNPSHIDARFFMAMQSTGVGPWVRSQSSMINNNLFYTYLLLKPGADARKLEAKFDQFIKKYAGEDLKAAGRNRKQFLTRVDKIHLYAHTERNLTAGGSLSYLYILISIAVVTLLIACINFMNLATARSSKRAVEIGVRKVLGAKQKGLVNQFLLEAIVLAFISFIVALILTVILLPVFEKLAAKEFLFSTNQMVFLGTGFLVISLIAGLIAGVYPAFYLSAFKPVKVLKSKFSNSLAAINFRKALVVFQFMISVALIVASITIGNQMRYMRTTDLGFEKDQQIIIPLRTSTAKEVYPSLKQALQSNSAISSVGASLYYPGIENVTDWLLYKQGTAPDQTHTVFMNRVDNSYLQTLGLHLSAGRLFSPEFPSDTANSIILNEQATKDFGFASPSDAIGKNIAATRNGQEVLFPIIGVVKDFHFKGFHSKIESYGFLLNRRPDYSYLVAHANPGNLSTALSSISSAWARLNPNEAFEYSFLDQDFQKNYSAESRLALIIRYFTIIAILISCLGLFGLTTFSVEQRTREIGIRKVLGASSFGIVSLLSKDFLKLILISFLVASPLAWYFIHRWLENFAYKAPFTIWIILIGWVIALLIAFLTISIQSVKVALSNPVKNLRVE
jgi:putative ABC transport system permease protein